MWKHRIKEELLFLIPLPPPMKFPHLLLMRKQIRDFMNIQNLSVYCPSAG